MRSHTTCLNPIRTIMMLVLSLAAAPLVGCAPLHGPRVTAPQNDSSLLIGTWEIVEFSRHEITGEVTTPFGGQAAGRITYDADGNVVALLMHEKRNEAAGRP